MCGPFTIPVDIPVGTTQTTQIASVLFSYPTPITVEGALNVVGDAINLTYPVDYITNTGSITSATGYGIRNASTITTLTNFQGGNSSVSYTHLTLPTNREV